MFVFPTMIAPSASRRATTVALYDGTKDSSILEAHVVRTPLVQKLSFTAIGIPAKRPLGGVSLTKSESDTRAAEVACEGVCEIENQCGDESTFMCMSSCCKQTCSCVCVMKAFKCLLESCFEMHPAITSLGRRRLPTYASLSLSVCVSDVFVRA